MIYSFIYTVLFVVAAFCTMFIYMSGKEIVIAGVAQDEVMISGRNEEKVLQEIPVRFAMGNKDEETILIPMEAGTLPEDVTVENHYMEKELWVKAKQFTPTLFERHAIVRNSSYVQNGKLEESSDGWGLKIKLTQLCEYRSVLEDGYLKIELYHPKEMYEQIIVIDPADDELSLKIAKLLKEKLDKSPYKAYYTRIESKQVGDSARLELTKNTQADFYIGIKMGEDAENPDHYGTSVIYNGNYFLPQVNGSELADMVERKVTEQIKGRAEGIFDNEDGDYLLKNAELPAVILRPGYISNATEKRFLENEGYQAKIAEGIFQAIAEFYESMELTENE